MELKFRAWNETNKEMIYPKKDYFYTGLTHGNLVDQCDNVMQYIGMKDMHGVDIYQDDICRILYTDWPSNTDPSISLEDYKKSISHIGTVVYDAPMYMLLIWNSWYGEYMTSSIEHGTHGEIEVIGNIHENPELCQATS